MVFDNVLKGCFLLGLILLTACSTHKQSVEVLAGEGESVERVAARLSRAGYQTLAGRLPLDEQLAEAWRYQRAKDGQGGPLYFVSSSKAKGRDFNVARMQAESLAKVQLAGLMQTRVGQLVTNQMEATGQYSHDAILRTVGSSKNLVTARLTQLVPLLEIYRDDPDGNVEVQVVIACPYQAAGEIAGQLSKDREL